MSKPLTTTPQCPPRNSTNNSLTLLFPTNTAHFSTLQNEVYWFVFIDNPLNQRLRLLAHSPAAWSRAAKNRSTGDGV